MASKSKSDVATEIDVATLPVVRYVMGQNGEAGVRLSLVVGDKDIIKRGAHVQGVANGGNVSHLVIDRVFGSDGENVFGLYSKVRKPRASARKAAA